MSIFIHSCDRCRDYFAGKSYHVSSEEKDGEKLLDMVVCYGCYIEAARLGLNAEAVDIGRSSLARGLKSGSLFPRRELSAVK